MGLFGSGFGKVAPPPPAPWDQGPPLRPNLQHVYFDNMDQLNAYCSLFSRLPPGQTYTSCFAWGPNTIALPTTKAWPNQQDINDMDIHEMGHARGALHDDSGGWIPGPGVSLVNGKPQLQTPQQGAAIGNR